jgi:phosphohistidine phosphatase
MDLILWRHADAEDGRPDLARKLTPKGHQQAREMAGWLLERLPQDFTLVASPATRAEQTAAALKRPIRIVPSLAPGATTKDILAAAGWPDGPGTVVLVGHQPDLGHAAAHLAQDRRGDWDIRKGALCWFTTEPQVNLKVLKAPDLS